MKGCVFRNVRLLARCYQQGVEQKVTSESFDTKTKHSELFERPFSQPCLEAMAGIQLRLQKELFAPNDEQLMAMAHCFKASSAATTGQSGGTTSAGGGLKRKEIYLCVLNDTSSTHHGNKGGLNIRSGH